MDGRDDFSNLIISLIGISVVIFGISVTFGFELGIWPGVLVGFVMSIICIMAYILAMVVKKYVNNGLVYALCVTIIATISISVTIFDISAAFGFELGIWPGVLVGFIMSIICIMTHRLAMVVKKYGYKGLLYALCVTICYAFIATIFFGLYWTFGWTFGWLLGLIFGEVVGAMVCCLFSAMTLVAGPCYGIMIVIVGPKHTIKILDEDIDHMKGYKFLQCIIDLWWW